MGAHGDAVDRARSSKAVINPSRFAGAGSPGAPDDDRRVGGRAGGHVHSGVAGDAGVVLDELRGELVGAALDTTLTDRLSRGGEVVAFALVVVGVVNELGADCAMPLRLLDEDVLVVGRTIALGRLPVSGVVELLDSGELFRPLEGQVALKVRRPSGRGDLLGAVVRSRLLVPRLDERTLLFRVVVDRIAPRPMSHDPR